MPNESTPHKRRVRYSGTHPKKFEEKYKELQPEKYADTISKVIQKGSTPAGMHLSICVQEILDFLQIKPGQVGLDATFGYGGHSAEMLKKLSGKGHLYALDVDPIESDKTTKRLRDAGFGPEILTVKLQNFADIDKVADEVGKFDFILADLGVSSMQIDNPERGFSYKIEGPLDLRMNPQKGISAADRLKTITKEELVGMLVENADEPYAQEIANQIIITLKRGGKIETTTQLREVIEKALCRLPASQRSEAIKKSCQRTFQALRIDVNNEFEVLYELLEKLPKVLNPGGRVAILTFHSGEDRLVKKSFKEFYQSGEYSEIAKDATRASKEECARNPRSKCAKLRWAIKSQDTGDLHHWSFCGDDCMKCPRYLADTDEKRDALAKLWYKIGWRDHIVSADEMKCSGCHANKDCSYGLISCIKEKGVEKCAQCPNRNCEKVSKMLEKSDLYQKKCKEVCTPKEYQMLEESFYHKRTSGQL